MSRQIWRFDTARFSIIATAEPEDMNPEDSFQFPEDIEFANSGDPAAWFCAKVSVNWHSTEVGSDYLGGCSYVSFEDFTDSFWSCGDDSRNTLANKARGINYGHYFPDMVRVAIEQARKNLADNGLARLRTSIQVPTQRDLAATLGVVMVGQRWRLKHAVDVENFAIGDAGDVGTIVESRESGLVYLRMDRDFGDFLSDWNNCFCFGPDEGRSIDDYAELVG